jgi:hypothetical protein
LPVVKLGFEDREESIELVNQFFKKINSLDLDGLFKIRPRAAAKFVDIYLKLAGTNRVLVQGYRDESGELVSLLIARIEEKPFLQEERTVYIDIAVTKRGQKKKGYMTSLLKSAEQWTKEQGIQSMELRAIKANEEAMDYWKSKDFEEFYVRFRKRL